MDRQLPALAVSLVLLVAAAGPAAAVGTDATVAAEDGLAVDVEQDGEVTVTVTDNETGVPNATVDVEPVDTNDSYAGAGTYSTGENGTVSLPGPVSNVTVSVTATVGNETASTETTLTAAEYENFGQRLTAFLQTAILGGANGPPGQTVSAYVLATNPSDSVPAHAGPGNDSDNRTGPPEDVGQERNGTDSDNRTGPPEDAGPDGNETDGGPPDHAGPSGDDEADGDDEDDESDGDGDTEGDESEEDESEDSDEDDGDEDEDGDGDDGTGPPEDNPGNGNGR